MIHSRPRAPQPLLALLVTFLLSATAAVQPAHGQEQAQVTQDLKFHDVGQVRQLVTNLGMLSNIVLPNDAISTEWPIGSIVEYSGDLGLIVGGISTAPETQGDTLVSHGDSFGQAPGGFRYDQVFWGYSDAPWDTIWVAERGDTLDIPYAVPYGDGTWYRPGEAVGYVPVASQDLVTRYNDYNDFVLEQQASERHDPLYLDVVQTSYAWSSPPLDDVVVVRFTIKATRSDIEQAYVGFFADPTIGYDPADRNDAEIVQDDYSEYNEELHIGLGLDAPGGPDGPNEPYGVIGNMLLMSDATRRDEPLQWTWRYGSGASGAMALRGGDGRVYDIISSGGSDRDQPAGLSGNSHYFLTAGPIDLPKDSTYTLAMAIVMGETREDVEELADVVQFAVDRNFKLPQPPPAPELRASVSSGTVHLDWRPREGGANPEIYEDPNRGDQIEQPFEGYRLWTSTESRSGPWTLLGAYDIEDNGYGPTDEGLKRQFTDEFLINNVPYYYSVTAFSKPDSTIDWPSQSSSIAANAIEVIPSPGRAENVSDVAVVPNPYRGDVRYQDFVPPWEKPPPSRDRWLEQDRRLTFINLPGPSTIRVYTVSGTLVKTIEHRATNQFFAEWNLTSSADQAIASGIYLFTVEEEETGQVHTGKFVVIK